MRKPNFDFERQERDKAKAAKKAEKANAKAAKRDAETQSDDMTDTEPASKDDATN